jgi:hypothetical protein
VTERDPKDKLSHAAVNYVVVSPHPGRHCSICEHFIKAEPPRCESVQLPIAAKAWCQRFEFASVAQRSGMRG